MPKPKPVDVNVIGTELGETVNQAATLHEEIKERTDRLDALKEMLRNEGVEHTTADTKSVKFSTDAHSAMVTFAEPSLKVVNVDELKEILGPEFTNVIEINYKVKDPERLRELMRSASNGFRQRVAAAVEESKSTPKVTLS
jgi:hypothetical protein